MLIDIINLHKELNPISSQSNSYLHQREDIRLHTFPHANLLENIVALTFCMYSENENEIIQYLLEGRFKKLGLKY